MTTNKRKGPLIDPGLCRCCGSTKKCRLLNVEYDCLGHKEIYSDMFFDCFGLLLSNLDGEPEDRLICATCVSRLRDSAAFRRQVLHCEEKLLITKIQTEEDIKMEAVTVTVEDNATHGVHYMDAYAGIDNDGPNDMKTEAVKEEEQNATQNDEMDACAGMDHDADSIKSEPVKKTKSKKKLKVKVKRKMKSKTVNGEHLDERKKLQRKAKLTTKINYIECDEPALKINRPKLTDNEQKAFLNTVTIVENSYVCPFDTSFSDYYCLYCREVFTDPNKLRDHTINHDPTTFKEHTTNKKLPQIDIMRIDCRLCPKRIDDIELFKIHLTNIHGKSLFAVNNEFLKFRLTLNNLTCTECNISFSFFHALKKHMAEHFGTCICDICGAHYFEERMLILHQKTHQRVEVTFPCKECGKSFKSKHSRYLHIARMHKKEPAYQCNKCDDVLFSYSLRYRHMIEVHGEQRMFPCEHCDRAYDSRKSLREHNRRFHLKIFKHQCDLCEKRFYLPSRLKEHMATHTGERNFRCEYCGKSYPRLRGLKVHMQSHSSGKKYACVICNASFTQNVNLKNHMKRQHQSLEVEDGYHE